ncbi:hypothetical protein L226DRAFT_203736 [Lentinus tigrinus ALCF2SS1-7]|uniref:F-box domain-containing protein n=1 Tax=Lentinus tigrinus ALCF2SS1-6 TaxID=1328759 RepID=A0A5C2STJ5_9APHY|nr:hypothetical protein L227DRAFT_606692 [Lentinus tigrinus ALCF2SS1-6]RPD80561.1 hypothetical protein L226DRAFT_203736 [Lentinus tigrinus ALCF2SS1-7]
MDSLAVELIAEVAFHACTDGGFTGSSLSVVSRRIRDATHTARFHSVSIASNPEAFAKFLDVYREQRHRTRDVYPRVRHLFLSLLPIEGEPVYRTPRLSLHNAVRAYEEHLRTLRDLGERHGATLCDLVRELAPDLETFAFVRGEWKNVPTVDCVFPRLRELSLIDGVPEFIRLEGVERPMFPRLERLHTVEYFHARPVDLCQFAHHAPHLVHYRCSGMHYADTATMCSLKLVTGPRSSEDESPLLPHLRRVMAQPTVVKHCFGDMQGQNRLSAELRACAAQARSGTRFHILVKHDPLQPVNTQEGIETAPERCIRKAKEEWMQRVEGGSGCWAGDYVF